MSNCIVIKGVPFDQITRQKAVKIILGFLNEEKKSMVTTPNPEFLVESNKNPDFKIVLQNADLSIPDGIGILWAATFLNLKKYSGQSQLIATFQTCWQVIYTLFWTLFFPKKIRQFLPERVCGSDLFLDLCKTCKAKIFLLGARRGVAQTTAKMLQNEIQNIQIVGTYAGSPHKSETNQIINKINQSQAKLLFVAYGSPNQELWIAKNLSKLTSVKVAIGIGGSFDFVAGKQKRAPNIMRKLGLEWLWRLIREPKRIRRIWNATGVFVKMIVKEKINH